ncbi:sensor histidine kinase [Paenibacillus allorhizosphaerae]|uniref:Histidine kinase n=1 Tax=Paenibacillus allorhizosphaerae TaxID=2849866 RepID=A0ABM8VRX3_9BACL|nr:sensor histidine kinase [Paenibacillus allorhizosphaerae]CAG7655870.1 hypothetical protein PAECIP111802_06234 [Paenibacillus allorhizosphaerae]
MWRWIAFSLQRKLSVIMLVSTLVPLLLLGGFAYAVSFKTTEQKTRQSGIDTMRQIQGTLEFILQDVENMSVFLIGQQDIQSYLSSPVEDMDVRSRITGFTANLVTSKPYISNITIFPANAFEPLSTMTIYESELEQQVNIREVSAKLWTGVYTIRNYAGYKNVITFIRPLRGVGTYRNLGWLSISLDELTLSRYLSERNPGAGLGKLLLLNDKERIISSTEKRWLREPVEAALPGITGALEGNPYGSGTYGQGEDKQMVLYYREPLVDWMLLGTIPYRVYSEQNRYLIMLTAGAVTLSILISAGLILFIVRQVTNPLRLLTKLLTRIDPNEPLPVYPVGSKDEIGRLAESYNLLGQHIETLKRQLIRNETRKKEADLRALQAQINPHFLYNTLSSIHWIALMREEKRIADMVEALSDFLRFSLNKGKDFCPVHQEIAHIKNYAQVQSIRFPDKFDLEFVVSPELQDKLMLKLLLQPLVENAMIHGIQKKEGRGTIHVYVEKNGDRMNFLVLDDGVGMPEERLQSIRANLESPEEHVYPGNSYGLRNVNERLLLHYGQDAQLHIESRLHAGTRVSFSIPIREAQHENHDRR